MYFYNKYVLLYFGKRYLCNAFACLASCSLYFIFISLVLFDFYAWFQVMLKAFICNSYILFVLILFKYVLLYLGKRYLCHAFACFASYSLYFIFISLVLFYFYAWFQVMLLAFVYHSYILLVLILFKYVLLNLGKGYLCHAFACLAFYSHYFIFLLLVLEII